jgi:carboxylesterase type B
MHLHILFSLLGSAFAQVQPISNTTSPLLTVNTTSGIYTGFVDPSLPQVHQWHGVPFATPPTSNLRFLPAIKAPYQSGGPHPATSYKPICIQNSHNTSGVFWTLVPEFQNTDPQSEDCLFEHVGATDSGGER